MGALHGAGSSGLPPMQGLDIDLAYKKHRAQHVRVWVSVFVQAAVTGVDMQALYERARQFTVAALPEKGLHTAPEFGGKRGAAGTELLTAGERAMIVEKRVRFFGWLRAPHALASTHHPSFFADAPRAAAVCAAARAAHAAGARAGAERGVVPAGAVRRGKSPTHIMDTAAPCSPPS